MIKQSEFEEIDEDTSLCFTPRDIYIWHKSTDENDKQGQNNRVFDIVLNVIIAQAYYRKMIGFRDRARKSDENTQRDKRAARMP